MGKNLLPEPPSTLSAPPSLPCQGTRAAQPSPDLIPESLTFNSNIHHTIQNTEMFVFWEGGKKNTAGPLCLFIARGTFGTCDIMKLQSTAKCLSQQQTQGQSRVAAACQWHPLSSRCPSTSAAPGMCWQPPPAAACVSSLPDIPKQNNFMWERTWTVLTATPDTHNTHLALTAPRTASVAVVTSTHLPHQQMDTSVRHSQQGSAGSSGFLPAQ